MGALIFLNSQSGYIKKDAYLCHVISDVKLSHCFLLSKVKNVLPNTQIIQKTIYNIKQKQALLEYRKTSTVKYTSL